MTAVKSPIPEKANDGMIVFQEETLRISESILAGTPENTQRLYKAFCASFLHYTRRTPDHWCHPRGTWTGFPDLPSTGSCVCLAVLLSGNDPEEIVLRYHEFLGAMASRLSPEEAAFALLSIAAAKKRYPEDSRFTALEDFLRGKAIKPDSESYVRAKRIAERMQFTGE